MVFPVENRRGRQADTQQINMAQGKRDKGQIEIQNQNNIKQGTKIHKETQLLGYVPIHIVNLSLEETEI